ncbi:DUF1711-domain-containing protein [Patellaria atrata CBS 101060]|uniref:DUF1711-domain-containing protein n=1 Tax=Patellaria atrata CBS 101060 TaxID=1346257 RepID=A0A9P4SB42_9PEZI|nr:DUF1711-domain-containing protein [Patellaria atrata CBS 101060]
MSPSTTLTMSSSPKSTNMAKSKLVKLVLSSEALKRFPHEAPVRKESRSKSSSSSTSTPAEHVVDASPLTIPSEMNESPAPNGTANPLPSNPSSDNATSTSQAANGLKRKGIPGPKPGSKRGPPLTADGLPKPRGKPGPKKKPRFLHAGDFNGDPMLLKAALGSMTTTQKLGPKANQGAINAGLRALDRSGKPCRKWERQGLQLKSFTGVVFNVPLWRAPRKVNVDENGDVKSDTTGSSEAKPNNDSSAVPSEKSNGNVDTPNIEQAAVNIVGSPSPAVATPA